MDASQRQSILEELNCVDMVILQTSDKDDSSSHAIMNFAIKYADSKICFCNGGDRKDNKTIRESEICNKYDVVLEYGIGGDYKAASSSELLNNYTTQEDCEANGSAADAADGVWYDASCSATVWTAATGS